eukprot:1539138-Rhodomonas_salina.1
MHSLPISLSLALALARSLFLALSRSPSRTPVLSPYLGCTSEVTANALRCAVSAYGLPTRYPVQS